MPKITPAKIKAKTKYLYEKAGMSIKEAAKISGAAVNSAYRWSKQEGWVKGSGDMNHDSSPLLVINNPNKEERAIDTKKTHTVQELDDLHEGWLMDIGKMTMDEIRSQNPEKETLEKLQIATNIVKNVMGLHRKEVRGIDKSRGDGVQMPTGFTVKLVTKDSAAEFKGDMAAFVNDLPNQDPFSYDEEKEAS